MKTRIFFLLIPLLLSLNTQANHLPIGAINEQDEKGKTALHKIIPEFAEDLQKAIQLIRAGADVNIQDNQGRTPLFNIIEVRDVDFDQNAVQFILQLVNAGADPNIKDREGKTVLMYASEYYFKKERQPMGRPVEVKYMPNLDYISTLLNHGADPDLKDPNGRTILLEKLNHAKEWRIISRVDIQVIEKLISHDANVNIRDREGQTALGLLRELKDKSLLVNWLNHYYRLHCLLLLHGARL